MKVSIDSRTIQPGDYYIPVKGIHFDGRDFIQEAIAKGGILLDVDLGTYARKFRKKMKGAVIAIAGSSGKTTVKDLLFSVLSQSFDVHKTEENQNNEIGAPLTLLKSDYDMDVTLVEVGMRKRGDLDFLSKIIRPTHVVLTGVGVTHAEFFSSLRSLALAKCQVFQPVLSWEKDRVAFLNSGHDFYELASSKARQCGFKVYPYGGHTKPEENVQLCYLVGRFFGLSDETVQKGITSFNPSCHRLHRICLKHMTIIDDTYNSNPDGVKYALQFIRQFHGRKIIVLGDMLELGDKSEDYHRSLIPDVLDSGCSILFTYGTVSSVIKPMEVPSYHFKEKQALLSLLTDEIKKDDIILIKGSRGLNMEWFVEELKGYVG